jgi:Uma2 family endonuclease
MNIPLPAVSNLDVEYPEGDGQPMAENTLQFQWIVTIEGNLDGMYANDPLVFVAGDLFWYPVEGHPEIRTAPDILVAFGRPKGYRGSYMQWREEGVAPQVLWEILSPGNTPELMQSKFSFYEQYGVKEHYVYDPDNVKVSGWIRDNERLKPIDDLNGWTSPRLGVRFDMSGDELVLYRPDGRRFLTFVELLQTSETAQRLADEAQQRAAEAQRQAAEAQQRAERLAERLRSLGIDPDQ